MGKRIPRKKHKGVRDPLLQIAKREESLKNVVNAPPKQIDFQEMPKSVENLMKLKQMTKDGIFNKRKKKVRNKATLMSTTKFIGKEKIISGMTKPDRDLPVLTQKPTESDRSFLNRVHIATNDFIKEVNFEVKHNMKMKKDEKTGKVKFDKIEMDPVDKMFQDKLQASQKKKKKHKQQLIDKGLSKTARRRLKLQAKKELQKKLKGEEAGQENEFERLQDKVAFNEVVHRPPQLTVIPRKAAALEETRRPGRKPGLLLAEMLSSGDSKKRDLTGRRKDLSMRDRHCLDTAQAAAIQAYRQLKASRSSDKSIT